MAITAEWQGFLLLFIQQRIHQNQAAALGDSWQWGTIQEPLGPIVWPAPVPASAPTHTQTHTHAHLCEASQSLYSFSNQHRLPSPPETHTTAEVNNYSRVILPVLDHPTLSPPDAATHTMPNTSNTSVSNEHNQLSFRTDPLRHSTEAGQIWHLSSQTAVLLWAAVLDVFDFPLVLSAEWSPVNKVHHSNSIQTEELLANIWWFGDYK